MALPLASRPCTPARSAGSQPLGSVGVGGGRPGVLCAAPAAARFPRLPGAWARNQRPPEWPAANAPHCVSGEAALGGGWCGRPRLPAPGGGDRAVKAKFSGVSERLPRPDARHSPLRAGHHRLRPRPGGAGGRPPAQLSHRSVDELFGETPGMGDSAR